MDQDQKRDSVGATLGGQRRDGGHPASDALTPRQASLHRNFVTAAGALKASLVRTAWYLERIATLKIHRLLGFRTIADYAAHYAGLRRSQTERLIAVARHLPDAPEVAAALAAGQLSWSHARLLVERIAPENHQEWLDLAGAMSVREFAAELKRNTPVHDQSNPPADDRPNPPTHDQPDPHKLDERDSTAPRTQPPTVPKRPRSQPGYPGPTPVLAPHPEVFKSPAGAQFVTLKLAPEDLARWESLTTALSRHRNARVGQVVMEALEQACGSGAGPDQRESSAGYLVTLITCPECSATAIANGRGETPAPPALVAAANCDAVLEDTAGRRRQSIPPRTRRQVFQRARYRCEAKGCRHAQFLEIHHRRPAAGAGGVSHENLVVLCSSCHRKLHRADAAAKGRT